MVSTLVVFLAFLPSAALARTLDYADSRRADAWLRHPVYGDPSFDALSHCPGNPIHRGAPPFEWPVNAFLFPDPVSGNFYAFIGDYGKGYMTPPSQCLLYRSFDKGNTWTNLGVVLKGDEALFDRGGHTPDVSVVYADHRYHMVYDWGQPNFTMEGGLAYAWAEHPEGPWRRAPEPITRNSTLPKLLGKYQRTYAATLLKRKHDWIILAMMDDAPRGWALFGITAPQPQGPYSDRRLLRHVEAEYFHPALMEFFPAFSHKGFAYAPATSVALNRNFNVLFRAPLEKAHDAAAWSVFRHGSVWHAEDVENEFYGIWGQTFAGAVVPSGVLHVLFPSRDPEGRGTINFASRPWSRPLRKFGFTFTGHQGPSLTLLRQAYGDFQLETTFDLRRKARLLMDYAAPLNPSVPSSDASLHPSMWTRHKGFQVDSGAWQLIVAGVSGQEQIVASGRLSTGSPIRLALSREKERLSINVNGQPLWSGMLPATSPGLETGVLGWLVHTNTHLQVSQFRVRGQAKPTRICFGATDALLGAGAHPGDWDEQQNDSFRFGRGAVSKKPAGRVKWNVIGSRISLWAPRGPAFGSIQIRLDGKVAGLLDLHANRDQPSEPIWESSPLRDSFHALVLTGVKGVFPVDCLEVSN